MPYHRNEKRFHKNSNGFEFHVHRYRTGEILDKIRQLFFFAVLKEQLQHIRTKASTLTPLLSDQ